MGSSSEVTDFELRIMKIPLPISILDLHDSPLLVDTNNTNVVTAIHSFLVLKKRIYNIPLASLTIARHHLQKMKVSFLSYLISYKIRFASRNLPNYDIAPTDFYSATSTFCAMSEHLDKPAEAESPFGGRWIPLESNPEVRTNSIVTLFPTCGCSELLD